jgi:hypothetical protein
MRSLKKLQARIDKALKEVEKTHKEVSKLQRELNSGTLDRKTLASGLAKVQGYTQRNLDEIPIFCKDLERE